MDNINYTIGALVVDRSGSMWNLAEDVKGSVNGINTLNSKFAQARMNEKLDFTQEERDEMARPASVPA